MAGLPPTALIEVPKIKDRHFVERGPIVDSIFFIDRSTNDLLKKIFLCDTYPGPFIRLYTTPRGNLIVGNECKSAL